MKHKKQMLAGFLALALFCGAGCAAVSADKSEGSVPAVQPLAAEPVSMSFSDVADSEWYSDAVNWCVENDIMSGVSDTSFSPSAEMVRITVADALYRAEGCPETAYSGEFTDVAAKSVYAGAAAWASANNIMSGYGGGMFGADDPVTREQLATILWRYAGSPAAKAGEDFADESSIADYAQAAVDWAQSTGIINGRNGNIFDPKATITRGETAVILYRYLSEGSQTEDSGQPAVSDAPIVYMTTDISPEGLIAVYEALGRSADGENVAVKISTGEGDAQNNYLRPELIGDFVQSIDGTIVECNTAVGGRRSSTAMHYQIAEDHGFTAIAPVVIMDETDDMEIPVTGGRHLQSDRVGAHFADYDFQVVLSHFKGHLNGGFGGAIKNMSIGYASSAGKNRIHTAGAADTAWLSFGGAAQDDFLESMAEAAKAVADYCGDNILYINVMNRLSVDCDCMANPREPTMADIGILASLDPVALDQACVDLVYAAPDGQALVQRIESLNGQHTLDYGQEIGLGSKDYILINIDDQTQIQNEENPMMEHQLQDFPSQPTGGDMRTIEFDYLPVLPQTAPVYAKELYEAFDSNLEVSEGTYSGHRFEVSGIAAKVGPDVHSKPSIELSDAESGKCYVLCVFNSDDFYETVSVGDHVVCRGNYLVASSLYGIVLKNAEVVKVGE